MPAFEVLPHTADAAIRAYGATLPELFANAAVGMFSLMAEVAAVVPRISVEVTVEADDRDSLLVAWLNELIYRFEVDGLLFSDFDISEIGETHLKAVAKGEEIDLDRHELRIQVKACTYHELKIEQTDSQWTAQLIFDV